jgi:hypothetical protein
MYTRIWIWRFRVFVEMQQNSFPLPLRYYKGKAVMNTERFPSVGKYDIGFRRRSRRHYAFLLPPITERLKWHLTCYLGYFFRSRDGVVLMVPRPWAGQDRNSGSIPGMGDCPHLQNVQTDSGARSPEVKQPLSESEHSHQSTAEMKNSGAMSPFPTCFRGVYRESVAFYTLFLRMDLRWSQWAFQPYAVEQRAFMSALLQSMRLGRNIAEDFVTGYPTSAVCKQTEYSEKILNHRWSMKTCVFLRWGMACIK